MNERFYIFKFFKLKFEDIELFPCTFGSLYGGITFTDMWLYKGLYKDRGQTP
jgi:hypothetical protein